MEEKEVRKVGKPFVVVAVTVLLIIILVGFLFYAAPKKGIGAGQAVYTGSVASVDSGTAGSVAVVSPGYYPDGLTSWGDTGNGNCPQATSACINFNAGSCFPNNFVAAGSYCLNRRWYQCPSSSDASRYQNGKWVGYFVGDQICTTGGWVPLPAACNEPGGTTPASFCDGTQWTTQCTAKESRLFQSNGQPSANFAGDGTANGCLSSGYNCIISGVIKSTGYPVGLNHLAASQMCANDGNWYVCGSENNGETRGGFICQGNQWLRQECTERQKGQIQSNIFCDGRQWQSLPACARGQSGLIAPAQGTPLVYCQNGAWSSLNSADNSAGICNNANQGKSLVGKLYCDGTQWSTACTVPQTPLYKGALLDRILTNPGVCCPPGLCYSSALGGTGKCVLDSQVDPPPLASGQPQEITFYCSSGSLYECNRNTAQTLGTFTLSKMQICYNGQWQSVAQGCTQQNVNEVYGQAYCSGQQWQPCSDVPGLLCMRNQPFQCNTQNKGTVRSGTEGSFYCSASSTWLKCEQSIVGQLQDESYVCADNGGQVERYIWTAISCQACLASNPGKCVGSNTVDVATGRETQDSDKYYFDSSLSSQTAALSSAVAQKAGCVDENVAQCTRNGNAYYVDQSFVSGATARTNNPVCGNDNRWQTCPISFNGYVPSDGGEYLCGRLTQGQASSWIQCSASTPQGQQYSGFTCTNINGKWQWFSQFACSPSSKYKLRGTASGATTIANTHMCDSSQWRACEYFDTNPVQDYNVNFSCQHPSQAAIGQRRITMMESACTNNLDDDNDGVSDCGDADCFSQLSPSGRYTVTMKRYGCLRANVDVAVTPTVDYQEIHLCDQGTERLADVATICSTQGTVQVQSVSALHRAAAQPQTYAQRSLTFLYFQPTSGLKEVHAVYTADISSATQTTPQAFPLSSFAPNMVNGQKLMLLLSNQMYMLSFPSNDTLFSFEKLQLLHIPTMRTYPLQQFSGSNQYVFSVENQQTVVVEVNTAQRQVGIFSRASGAAALEVAAGYVTPQNLVQLLEVPFTQTSPVEISLPVEVGKLTICREDNPADTVQALLCHADIGSQTFQRIASLRLGNLTRLSIGAADYALLYELTNTTKKVSVYKILTPGVQPAPNLIPYNEFINAMAQGRRVAVEMRDEQGRTNLYLAEHPTQATFSLPVVKLKTYKVQGTTEFVASGSVDRVEFMVLDGRITIQRNYGTPPPPFDLFAETKRQIADTPLNLEQALFTSMSSEVPVRIDAGRITPTTQTTEYGIISAAPNDIALFQPTFRVQRTAPGISTFDLPYRVPVVDGIPAGSTARGARDTLFYYHSARIEGEVPIKTVSIHRLYELPNNGRTLSHTFDNSFISTFTKGKEMALKFENSVENQADKYYLLGYQGADPTVQFFDINKVTLKSLKDAAAYQKTVSGQQVLFTNPEGIINVTVITDQSGNDRIEFSTITQIQVATTQLQRDYAYTIGTADQVLIDTQLFSMCNVQVYSRVTAANVCYGQGTTAQNIVVDGVTAFRSPQGTTFLLESNGRTGDNKRVIIRKMVHLNKNTPRFDLLRELNWTWFTDHVISGDMPVFNVTGKNYLPITQSSLLQDLQFVLHSDAAQRVVIRNIYQKSPILFNGSFVFGQHVIVADQELTGEARSQTVGAKLELQSYTYLPDDDSEVMMNVTANPASQSLTFTSLLNGAEYVLEATPTSNPKLLLLHLQRDGTSIMRRYFAEGKARRLILEGQLMEIRVKRIYIGEDRNNPQFFHADLSLRRQ